MNYQELAQKVKAKYPGQYDDLDDRTLAQKVVAKHPEYSDTTFDGPSIIDKTMAFVNKWTSPALSIPGAVSGPIGLPAKGYDIINQVAGRVGEKVATTLAQKGADFTPLGSPVRNPMKVSPNVAAAIGTGVAMTPDIIMSAVNPESEVPRSNLYAQDKALTAMGTPKRLLKGPGLVDRARMHSQTLLDAGLIKPLRGAQGMADELASLEASSGQKIGSILDQLGEKGKVFDPQEAIVEINKLRPVSKSTGQILRGGAYDTINKKIDNAVATIQAHLPQLPDGGTLARPLSFQEANDLKGVLQGLANYASNKEVTLLDKVIAGKFRDVLDTHLEKAASQINDPGLASDFQQVKKLYGATQFAKDPIYNKLSAELTNKKISLTDWILGSHAIATGNPLTAALEVGVKKGLEKFGPSTQAVISNKLSKLPRFVGPNTANAAYILQRGKKRSK